MSIETVYDAWRPESSIWSRWVKPVLFSYLTPGDLVREPDAELAREWNVSHEAQTAVLIDLPGAEGLLVALALARAGWRPIPVYNAIPFPTDDPETDLPLSITRVSRVRAITTVDLDPVLRAIVRFTPTLLDCHLPNDAPPAFVIDQNRKGMFPRSPGCFDNRSFLSTSDFPSAVFLKDHGIRSMAVIRSNMRLDDDARSVLLSWQQEQISIRFQQCWEAWDPRTWSVPGPSRLSQFWHHFGRLLGYPDHESGAFGEWRRPSSS
jgi:hypothetical protein